MVDLTIAISILLILITFLVLLVFIKRLENEATYRDYQGKDRMVSLSARKLPFENVSMSENEDVLKLSVKASSSFSVSYSCYVAATELHNVFVNKKDNHDRSLLDTIKVLSLWTSNLKEVTVTQDEENHIIDNFNLKDLPQDIYDQLKALRQEKKKDFCPFTIFMGKNSIDGLIDNDIVSLLVLFSSTSLQPEEYYMETLSGNVYPIKKLYSSGVQADENATQSSVQLCVVCQTNPVTRVSLPCRHASVCKSCYHRLEDFCPICRQRITSYFPLMDESFLPATEEETLDSTSAEIRNMGWWAFIKSVWNAG